MSTLFDIIFLLRPDDLIIDERLAQRTSNHKNFAKTTQEREVILRNRHEFEKACLDSGALVISNNGSLQSVVGEIIKLTSAQPCSIIIKCYRNQS